MWLAALKMFCEMAAILKKKEDEEKFASILKKGATSYEKKLWNGIRFFEAQSW